MSSTTFKDFYEGLLTHFRNNFNTYAEDEVDVNRDIVPENGQTLVNLPCLRFEFPQFRRVNSIMGRVGSTGFADYEFDCFVHIYINHAEYNEKTAGIVDAIQKTTLVSFPTVRDFHLKRVGQISRTAFTAESLITLGGVVRVVQ